VIEMTTSNILRHNDSRLDISCVAKDVDPGARLCHVQEGGTHTAFPILCLPHPRLQEHLASVFGLHTLMYPGPGTWSHSQRLAEGPVVLKALINTTPVCIALSMEKGEES
jgi:hypothetical protein